MRRALCVLCGFVIALVGLTVGPSARAADGDELVRVQFSQVQVPLTGDGQVVVAGTVTNLSQGPLHNVQAMVWRDTVPITTGAEFQAALQSDPTQPLGRRVCCELGTFQDLTTPDAPLAPGASAEFQITLTVADLTWPEESGAYLIGLHLRGSTDGSAPWTIGRARTFALRATDNAPTPTITSVVVLSSSPSMIRDDVFVDDHLAEELAPGGRLQVLLASAARADVSHAIDPALLDEVIAMSDGYQVRAGDGSLHQGAGAAAADEWLVGFEQLAGDRYRLPYALPDLPALAGIPDQGGVPIVDHARDAADSVPAVADAPTLVLGTSAELTEGARQLADRFEPAAIVTSNVDESAVLLEPVAAAPLVRTDPQMYAGGPAPHGRADPIRVRQRLQAEAFIAALNGDPVPIRVINTVESAQLDEATPSTFARQSLDDLLGTAPTAWDGRFVWTDTMQQAQLEPVQLGVVEDLVQTQELFNDLLVEPDERQAASAKVIGRGVSGWWRDAADAQRDFLTPATEDLSELNSGDAVSLRAPKRVTLSMREGTSFPATITNELDQSVRVRPEFSSVQGQRIQFPEQEPVTVAPGESITVNIEPIAEVNGTVEVSGQLSTPNGYALGEPVLVVVEVTDLGLAAWVIVVISGLVLVGTTTLRIRQVRARQNQEDAT